MMGILSDAQRAEFEENGYVVAKGVATAAQLQAMSVQLDTWIEESRAHQANYGHETVDGKARFDLEDGHTAAAPRLRRVGNPVDVSETFREVLFDSAVPDVVAELIGPDVKFHHCKLNIKLPGMATRVEYHQDHAYDPHTNDDMVTALLLLDNMNEANGCLRVVPGSHRTYYSHYQGGRFTGQIDPVLFDEFQIRSVPIEGKAGDLCVMSTWSAHGGGPNLSDRPRRLLICDYNAAHAFPLTTPKMPSPYHGRVVRGKDTRVARFRGGTVEMPQAYEDDSFFGLQGQKAAGEPARGA